MRCPGRLDHDSTSFRSLGAHRGVFYVGGRRPVRPVRSLTVSSSTKQNKKLVQIPVAIYFHVLYLPEFRGRHPGEEFRLRDVDLGHFVIDRSSRPIILFVLSVVFPIAFLIRRDGSAPQTRRSNQTKCCYYYVFLGSIALGKMFFFYAINKTAPG